MQKFTDEKGYPWFWLDVSASWFKTLLGTLAITGICIVFLIAYSHLSSDLSPDSFAGYAYAITGTVLMLLATFAYAYNRKSRQRKVGDLNKALNWHICFGVSALIVLLFHSFGNFNPRTGTYALYGMIALVVSGCVGRVIDRVVPRLITREARKALTEAGDDRLESISQTAEAIVKHNTEQLQGIQAVQATNSATPALVRQGEAVVRGPVSMDGSMLPGSWDIAYLTLEETPQEASLMAQHYRFVPDHKSPLTKPGALVPGYDQQIKEMRVIQEAMQHEQFYRALIRYWRLIHVLLVLATIGLTLWHIEYAATLLLPLMLHH